MVHIYRITSLLAVLSLFLASPAPAQQVESDGSSNSGRASGEPDESKENLSFEELARAGVEHYDNGEYEEVIEYFDRAFNKKDEPDMLYNLGRSHEHLKNYEKAIQYYTRYAERAEIPTEDRQEALSRIETIRELSDLKKPSEASESESSGGGMQTAGWILTAGGGGAVAGGTVLAILASASRASMGDAANLSDAQAARNRARNQALFADILFGTGVVAAGAGTVLLFAAADGSEQASSGQSRSSKGVQIRPVFVEHGFGLTVRGDF